DVSVTDVLVNDQDHSLKRAGFDRNRLAIETDEEGKSASKKVVRRRITLNPFFDELRREPCCSNDRGTSNFHSNDAELLAPFLSGRHFAGMNALRLPFEDSNRRAVSLQGHVGFTLCGADPGRNQKRPSNFHPR